MAQVSRGTLTSAGPHKREEGAGAARMPAEPGTDTGQRPSLAPPVSEGLSEARALGEGSSASVPAPIGEREHHERQHEEPEEEGGEEGAEGADGEAADAEAAAAGGEEEFVREHESGHAGGHHRHHRRHNDTGLALGDDLTADFDFDADPGTAHTAHRFTSALFGYHRLSTTSYFFRCQSFLTC